MKLKSNKGITLIVLVITIIVLLVLAGVAIASLTGNKSITDRAQQAKSKSEEAAANEELKLDEYVTKINNSVQGNSSLNEYGFYYNKKYTSTTLWENGVYSLTITDNGEFVIDVIEYHTTTEGQECTYNNSLIGAQVTIPEVELGKAYDMVTNPTIEKINTATWYADHFTANVVFYSGCLSFENKKATFGGT